MTTEIGAPDERAWRRAAQVWLMHRAPFLGSATIILSLLLMVFLI